MRKSMVARILVVGSLVVGVVATGAQAGTFLEIVNQNPKLSMGLRPAKSAASNALFLEQKESACRQNRSRNQIMSFMSSERTFPITLGEDDIGKFFRGEKIERNLLTLSKDLNTGKVAKQPWSGDYWAINNGGIAKRFADSNFPQNNVKPWIETFNFYEAHPSTETPVEHLSPAEKYDKIVGDENFSLTKANWQQGKAIYDREKKVESWMGLCHGWAPAAFMEPRPDRDIVIEPYKVDDSGERQGGDPLTLHPHDVKALFTAQWAHSYNMSSDLNEYATRFLGGRCDVKDPKVDEESGRIIDPNCFDLDPSLWHLAVIHQVGANRKPLIIDASYDYEVWNQPVNKYSIEYFNPKNFKAFRKLEQNIVDVADPEFTDRFKKFRENPEVKKIIGVHMKLTYVSETSPNTYGEDDESLDLLISVEYYYDLELDDDLNIIGGEWYQNQHPDFIWMPAENSIAINQEDLYVESEKNAVFWAPHLSRKGSPLRFVIQSLSKNFSDNSEM